MLSVCFLSIFIDAEDAESAALLGENTHFSTPILTYDFLN